jgi:hypothetical protein
MGRKKKENLKKEVKEFFCDVYGYVWATILIVGGIAGLSSLSNPTWQAYLFYGLISFTGLKMIYYMGHVDCKEKTQMW